MTRVLAIALLLLAAPSPALSGNGKPTRQWKHDWMDGAVFYQVFVRSFFDSNGDGIGDLRGLIEKLDYLNDGNPATTGDLGVQGLWLMPIFPSPSYHGYDVTDYLSIEPDYGDLGDFWELLAQAEQRGIRVILDLVINHTSSEHPWFTDATATGSYRDWYVWSETNPGWTQPWGTNPAWHPSPVDDSYYYGLFWGGMPDLNLQNKKTRKGIERIAAWWLKRGVAGFRLDAARYLIETGGGPGQADTPETHAFWRRLASKIRRRFPQAVLVGENWADSETIGTYFGSTETVATGDELSLNFNFPLAEAILRSVRNSNRGAIDRVLDSMARTYPNGARDAPFLSNHDQRRLATELRGEAGQLRVAASILLTLPGVPFMYYGEEVGVRNGPTSGDESKRTPMPWDDTPTGGFTTGTPWFQLAPGNETANVATQGAESASLLSHYRGLIRARSQSTALGSGELLPVETGNPAVLAFVRGTDSERVLVAVNLGDGFQTVSGLALDTDGPQAIFLDGTGPQLTGGTGNLSLLLPPHSSGIWRLAGD